MNQAIKCAGMGILVLFLNFVPGPIGIILCGGGDGASFFLQMLFSPFSVAPDRFAGLAIPFWICVGALIALRRRKWARRLAAAILLINYVFVILTYGRAMNIEASYIQCVWELVPGTVLLFFCLWLFSQTVLWTLVFRDKIVLFLKSHKGPALPPGSI